MDITIGNFVEERRNQGNGGPSWGAREQEMQAPWRRGRDDGNGEKDIA